MKTAMMELIESLKLGDIDGNHNYAIWKATELLEKEKEQIINAHMAGDFKMDGKEAGEYYSKTYNSKL